ncbi:MAG TPA: hypothetical protein K8V00_09770 [Ligilactobacillus acidipiscis]|uniref:Uncharacterized protein n=1 Tax=Ligilactobacillus acidipiscis TaxID=89059 RepID=A0A921K1D4_9LACO|nr:hypothetical protein [Ligilactobacillus acidipiscis]
MFITIIGWIVIIVAILLLIGGLSKNQDGAKPSKEEKITVTVLAVILVLLGGYMTGHHGRQVKTDKAAESSSIAKASSKKESRASSIAESKDESKVLAKASSNAESTEKENMKKSDSSSSSVESSNVKETDNAKSKLISDIESYGKDKSIDHVLIRNGRTQVYMTSDVNDMQADQFKPLAKQIYDQSVQLGHQDEFAVYDMYFYINGSQIIAKVDATTKQVEILGE